MKKTRYLISAFSLASMAILPSPALAQNSEASPDEPPETSAEAGANELDEFTKIFSSVFEKDDTPIEPGLLSKGERIAAAVVPEGSYRKIMAETFQKVVEPMMESVDAIPLSTIAGFAGVSEDDITLKEGATLADLMMIVDPYYKQRNRAMMGKITEIMIDLSDDIEPSIRQGMARAYARRFSGDDLEAVAQFYETEAGAKIAGESLSIFASPEVMSASMEMMPKFMEQFFGAMEEITKGSDDIPPPRAFGDLSDAEKEKLGELMGVEPGSMSGAGSGYDSLEGAESADAVTEGAEMAADEPWSNPANWTEAEQQNVNKLIMASDEASEKYYDAVAEAEANAKKRLESE